MTVSTVVLMSRNIVCLLLFMCHTSAFAHRKVLQAGMIQQMHMPTAATAVPGAAVPEAAAYLESPAGELSIDQAYQKVVDTGEPDVHLYFSISKAPPQTPCNNVFSAEHKASCSTSLAGCLHIAVSAPTDGYVAVAFAGTQGKMFPADAVIATTAVNSYYIHGFGVSPHDITAGWAFGMGYVQQRGVKTLCFSRRFQSNEAKVVQNIPPDAPLFLNWAYGYSNSLGIHAKEGSVAVIPSSHSSTIISDNGSVSLSYPMAIWVHGALMLASFILLMPTAALSARHKWLAGNSQTAQIHPVWFYLHRACTCGAILTATAAFVLIFVRFKWISTGRLVNTYTGHRAVGITAFTMMWVQGLLGALRPHLGAPKRPAWRHLHQAWGWLTTAMGTAASFMGIRLVAAITANPLSWYLAPAVSVTGLIVLVGCVLEVKKFQLQQAGCYDKNTHTVKAAKIDQAGDPMNMVMVTQADTEKISASKEMGGVKLDTEVWQNLAQTGSNDRMV